MELLYQLAEAKWIEGGMLYSFPESKRTADICIRCLKNNAQVAHHVPTHLHTNPSFIIELTKTIGLNRFLRNLTTESQWIEVVSMDGNLLCEVPAEFHTKRLVSKAVKCNPEAIVHLKMKT